MFLGLCATTRSNDEIITNILFVLKKIGLIDVELKIIDNKTMYELKEVRVKC